MPKLEEQNSGTDFLKSLGFPTLDVHETFTHFDFTTPGRRVLLIGPMGAGKTEKAAGIWRDAAVALKKSDAVSALTSTGIADRRRVFFIRYAADSVRFQDYPDDALPYRSGYVRCGSNIAKISDSFGLEQVIKDNSDNVIALFALQQGRTIREQVPRLHAGLDQIGLGRLVGCSHDPHRHPPVNTPVLPFVRQHQTVNLLNHPLGKWRLFLHQPCRDLVNAMCDLINEEG